MTRLVAGMVVCLIAGSSNLSAQTRTSSEAWEVEFHLGGAFITTPEDGDGSLPGGTRLTNVGVEMWQVPSWYFGDGASLLTRFPLPRTSPLDSVLLGRIARREQSATFGASAARRLTNHLRVEGTVDFSSGVREATAATRAALEASRASFVEFWRGFPTLSDDSFVRRHIVRRSPRGRSSRGVDDRCGVVGSGHRACGPVRSWRRRRTLVDR
jgi:hypothetical protein